ASAPAAGCRTGSRGLVEVVDIMRVNVDKVLERDQKLSELDDRADALQAGASQFESCAAKLKNKYWWKNCKTKYLLLCFACSKLFIIIIIIIVRCTQLG
uniref:Vesicle associated membrane protein 1b n=1 Tax=Acanthochromis polyacanthus TaxID=80966 RepID=A0A3Q1ET23_9TELE